MESVAKGREVDSLERGPPSPPPGSRAAEPACWPSARVECVAAVIGCGSRLGGLAVRDPGGGLALRAPMRAASDLLRHPMCCGFAHVINL